MYLRTFVAVMLVSAFGMSLPAAAKEYTVVEKGKAFDRKEITIKVGDEITFVNKDNYTHNLYSRDKGHQFDTGAQAPSKSHTVLFDKAGFVKVRCAIHPKMKLKVTVE